MHDGISTIKGVTSPVIKSPDPMALLDGFTIDDINELASLNSSLRGYLSGYLAELVLKRKLKAIPGVESVTKIPDQDTRKGDFEVIYKGTLITVECKSVHSGTTKYDPLHENWVGAVGIKNSDSREVEIGGKAVRITNLQKGTFDIMAVNCYAVCGDWSFLFVEPRYLPEPPSYPGYIKTRFVIEAGATAGVTESIEDLLEKVYLRKNKDAC